MKFNKLALAAAVAAAPMTGMAMEPMQDEALSDVTGQDGLAISLGLNVTQNINIIDRDGITTSTAAYANAGAIRITNMGIDTGTGSITLNVDAGADAANAQLQTRIVVPNTTTIDTGDIAVSASGAGFGNYSLTSTTIIPTTQISLSAGATLEVNLGSEGAGESFINVTSANLGTISFGTGTATFSINDADGSSIHMEQLDITGLDASGTTIDVATTGLVIDLTGSNLTAVGMQITDLSFNGGTDIVGDVEITGLNLTGSTVTINGK